MLRSGHGDMWWDLPMTTTVESFLTSNDISGALTPEQAAALLELPHEGETADEAETVDEPASTPAEESEAAAEATPDTTTDKPEEPAEILAKDGKHTIPFEKLAEARASAQAATEQRDAAIRRAAELEVQLAAARQPATEIAKPAESIDLKALNSAWLQAVYDGEQEKALELQEKLDAEKLRIAEDRALARFEAKASQERAAAETAAFQDHAKQIKAAYPALDESGPSANAEAIEFVIFKRDAALAQGATARDALDQAVKRAVELFGWAGNGQAKASDATANTQAVAAIARAKAPTPNTLSDIHGGKPTGPAGDRLAGKSGPELVDAFSAMSRTQIEELLNRTM